MSSSLLRRLVTPGEVGSPFHETPLSLRVCLPACLPALPSHFCMPLNFGLAILPCHFLSSAPQLFPKMAEALSEMQNATDWTEAQATGRVEPAAVGACLQLRLPLLLGLRSAGGMHAADARVLPADQDCHMHRGALRPAQLSRPAADGPLMPRLLRLLTGR